MRPSKTWLIADSHFGEDGETIISLGRPLDFEKTLIHNLKYYVQPNDVLVHLGDVVVGKKKHDLKNYLNFPCTKILVLGNHDKQSINWYHTNGFDVICEEITIKKILFTHKPKARRKWINYNVHGHFHDFGEERWEPELKSIYDRDYHRLLSLERCFYKPISMDDFLAS